MDTQRILNSPIGEVTPNALAELKWEAQARRVVYGSQSFLGWWKKEGVCEGDIAVAELCSRYDASDSKEMWGQIMWIIKQHLSRRDASFKVAFWRAYNNPEAPHCIRKMILGFHAVEDLPDFRKSKPRRAPTVKIPNVEHYYGFDVPEFPPTENKVPTPIPSPTSSVSSDERKSKRRIGKKLQKVRLILERTLTRVTERSASPKVTPKMATAAKLTAYQWKTSLRCFGLECYRGLCLQAGRATNRAERETKQRAAARARDKAAYKALPKAQREKLVKAGRDKRNPALQAGNVLPAVAGAAIVLAAQKLLGLVGRADKAVKTVQSFLDVLSDFAEQCKKAIKGALWLVPLVTVCYYAFTTIGGDARKVIAGALLAVVGKYAWGYVGKFFQDDDISLQSGPTTNMAKVMATTFAFSVFGSRFGPREVTEFGKRISMIERVGSGFETVAKWILSALETLLNFVRKRFGKSSVQFFKDAHAPLTQWFKDVDKLICQEGVEGAANNTRIDEMVRLVKLGVVFKETYRFTDMQRTVDEAYARLNNIVMTYNGSIAARDNFRQEPVMLCILGPPGIGKTLTITYIVTAIAALSEMVPDNDPVSIRKEVWQKGSSEYWNGYCGQKVLIIDDAFQERVSINKPENDFMNVVRAISSWVYPLNMADLPSKGKFNFVSELVVANTNTDCIVSEAALVLNKPEAVVRRITMPYAMRVKSEFALPDGKLDYDKFCEEKRKLVGQTGLAAFPFYIWELARHDYATGTTSNVWVPMTEIIVKTAQEIKKRREDHARAGAEIDNFIAGLKLQTGAIPVVAGVAAAAAATSPWSVIASSVVADRVCDSAFDKLQDGADWLNDALTRAGLFVSDHTWKVNRITKLLSVFAWGVAAFFVGSTILGLLTTTWRIMCRVFRWSGKDNKTEFQSNVPKLNRQSRRAPRPDLQSGEGDSALGSLVYANSYKAWFELSGSSTFILGQVIWLESQLALQPLHFSQRVRQFRQSGEISDSTLIHFKNAVKPQHSFSVSVGTYLAYKRKAIPESDVEFISFEGVRAHRRITQTFLLEKELKYVSGARAQMIEAIIDYRDKLQDRCERNTINFDSAKYCGEPLRIPTGWGPTTIVKRTFTYKASTQAGSCGAPLVLVSGNMGRVTFGIHIAGDQRGFGYCTIVTQEMVEEAIKELSVIRDEMLEDFSVREHGVSLQCSDSFFMEDSGSFLPIGIATVPVNLCPKTSYYPTKLFGTLGDYDHRPAPLSPVYRDGQLVYPMKNALKPYATPLKVFDLPLAKTAMHVAMRPFMEATKHCNRRIYSYEEAVLGIPGEKFRSIPRGTAPGYPYVYELKGGKKEFFGEEGAYDLTRERSQKLCERQEYIVEKARQNVRLSHIFVDFNKDELRTSEKVKQVATRLISSSPLDYSVAWRRWHASFMTAMMTHNVETGMAPGVCVYTDAWRMARHLRSKGEKCFDGDFKAFDASEQPLVHELILDFVNQWYDDGEENARIRRVLWQDLFHSRHIGGDGTDQRYVYQWNKSLPSGHPFTTIVNSIYSLFLIVYSYMHMTGDLSGFWEHVAALTYGDDNVNNVSDEVAEDFNQVTLASCLEEVFGVKYTPGDKSTEYKPTVSLPETSFLKRKLVIGLDDAWVCPLELDSFLYTVYWCKNRRLEPKILHDVLECALEELSLHEPRVWDSYAPQIAGLLHDLGHITRVPCEQREYLRLIRSRSDNWY